MSALHNFEGVGPGPSAGPSALSRLVAVGPDDFADRYWARQALLTTAEQLPRDFTDLLDEDGVDELVTRRGLRTPFLRVAKNGSTLGNRTFTAPGGVGATIDDQVSDDKLVGLFAGGATMVLQALHRIWPPIIDFCQQLSAELQHPVQANAYVTPPQNQGFSNHYDVHDVFVLQLAGTKEWTIHAPVHSAPLRDEPWTDRRAAVEARAAEPPLIRTVLRPGDCLYLPRGFLHAAKALGGVSTHLTIGVHTWTRYALAERLLTHALREAATDESVRSSLPPAMTLDDPVAWKSDLDLVREHLISALHRVDGAALVPDLLAAARAGQRAAPVGPLAQLRALESLEPHAVVRLRKHLLATLEPRFDGQFDGGADGGADGHRGGGWVLRSRAAEVAVTEAEEPAVRGLLVDGEASAERLGVELTRRLITAGVVVLP